MDRKAAREAKRVSSKLQSIALRSFAIDDFSVYRERFFNKIVPLTRDLMIAAYLKGREVARDSSNNNLELANPFIPVLRDLRKSSGISSFIYETIFIAFEQSAETKVAELYNSLEKSLKSLETLEQARERFQALGITVNKDYLLKTLYRTASSAAFNAGQWDVYINDDSLWGFTYSAVLDDVTRVTHRAQNGVTLPKHDSYWSIWWPPNGYNCRCLPIPVYKSQNWVLPKSGFVPDPGFEFNSGRTTGVIGFSV